MFWWYYYQESWVLPVCGFIVGYATNAIALKVSFIGRVLAVVGAMFEKHVEFCHSGLKVTLM